ncbi:uncharacterized protein LOC120982451 [Bufo bufo]|uniref:uncharacterized protein LOC120982451 n=1 Tax=Bufo bufo TaxID=8384 RepID=UPI001ABEAC45|nr:uncharacterized protein LOC120982451 [Bufo bufo]
MPLMRRQLASSFCCWVIVICLWKDVSCCESNKSLTVDEGEDVILEVGQTQPQLSYITWDFEKHIIAITRPGQALQLEKYSYRYPGRLFSSDDGSLIITRLMAEDRLIYRADQFDVNWHYLCVQLFDVRKDVHDGISPNVDPAEACSPTKPIFHDLGENVTLQLPSNPRVANVLWDINNIDHIAITQPGGIMYRQDPSYRGKLSVMRDGSLKIFKVTTKDQHVYRAELFTKEWSHLCHQQYDVKLKNISSPELSSTRGVQNGIRLVLSACILLTILSILLYHLKTETSRTPQ